MSAADFCRSPAPPAGAGARWTLAPLIAATYFIVAAALSGWKHCIQRGVAGAIAILLVTPFYGVCRRADGERTGERPAGGRRVLRMGHARSGPLLGIPGSLAVAGGQPVRHGDLTPRCLSNTCATSRHRRPPMAGIWIGVGWLPPARRGICWRPNGGISAMAMGFLLLAPFAVLAGYALLHPAHAGATIAPLHRWIFFGGVLVAMWNLHGWITPLQSRAR